MRWRRFLATLFMLAALLSSVASVAAQGAGSSARDGQAGSSGPRDGVIPIVQVLISGPASGQVDTSYDFTAAAYPITATVPITYFWEATGQSPVTHVSAISDTVSFSWDSAGSKTITVTATNPAGSVLDTQALSLSVPKIYLPILTRTCNALFADDFSNPASGWAVGNTGLAQYEYLNGEYRMLLHVVGPMAGDYQGFQAADFVAQLDVRPGSSVSGRLGLAFGISSDWAQFYEFDVDPSGNYQVNRHDPSGWAQLTSGSSGAINLGLATNTLKVTRSGAAIGVYANGHLLASLSDGTYLGPRLVGLVAFTYNQPNFDARFDNLVVYAPDCSPISAPANSPAGLGLPHWPSAPTDGQAPFGTR